ncbi:MULTISPECIES: translation initiation factor 2 [unclassified Desulfovibrio]|uniref:translation initiation factor 2 n=1 Tax=unclassified Desulfovibrio TaxID=2593640 RepID=UPI002FD918AF
MPLHSTSPRRLLRMLAHAGPVPLVMQALILATIFILAPVSEASALTASKGVSFYARDMEFYYKENRPETLPGILRSFDAQNVLYDRQKQLTLAAFLAETLKTDPTARQRLLPLVPSLSRDGKRTLAWAVHLAGLTDEAALMQLLLDKKDTILLQQIQHNPTPLLQWNLTSEKTVLQMYWAAYTASGNTVYLDAIIDAALRYADLNSSGRQNDPAFAVSQTAAASLYEMAPRHESVHNRVRQRLEGLSGPQAEALRTILRQ